MQARYKYHFHPSILRTNRQVQREASHVLYAENDMIRVSSCKFFFRAESFEIGDTPCTVPVLVSGERAETFTRHAMEIVMLREVVEPYLDDVSPNCFIIVSDDLPRFCQFLLVEDRYSIHWPLDHLTLAIEIYIDRAAVGIVPLQGDETLVEGEMPMNCYASSERDSLIKSETSSKGDTPRDELKYTEDEAANPIKRTRSIYPSPRVLRLLEPLHKLHSLQRVHIEGSLDEHYKTNLLLSMCGSPPNNQELFDIVLAKFEDAMSTHEEGNQYAALIKMKHTLDTLKDQKYLRKDSWNGSGMILTGRYAGYTIWEAERHIESDIHTRLAWAWLDMGDEKHVCEAHSSTITIIGGDTQDGYWNLPPMGHKAAMAFYLKAHVWEAFDRLGDHDTYERSFYLGDLVRILREGLRHDPFNPLLEAELQKRVIELETEHMMELWDRIHEEGPHAPRYARW